MYTVNPQLVILVNKNQEITDVLYLTLYGSMDERSSMVYFIQHYLMYPIEKVRVLKRHIILTLKIPQLKGYVRSLLNLNEEIIIYSHKSNVEYSYVDNTTFNPFTTTQQKTLIKSDGFLYNTYLDACNFLVIWVVKASDTMVKELGSYDEVDDNVLKFESRLVDIFNDLNLEFTVETKFNNIFKTNLKLTGLWNILLNNKDKKILLIKSDKYFINMSGNHFVLNDEPVNLSIWDERDSLAITSDGNTITVNNVKLFTDVISNGIQMERIKSDITYKVILAAPITSNVKLDIETSFIFVETATNNILLSVDKKISIILAKNHISIKVKNHIPDIEKYFTFLIIFITSLFNRAKQTMDFTKIETIYWSRICQNTKNKNRKPVITHSLKPDMIKVSDNFYKSKHGEVFINKSNIMFTCNDENNRYNYIGFLSIFYKLQKICVPCCFLKEQYRSDTFQACVHNKVTTSKSISPYILNYGKVITDTKISFLPPIFNDFLNSDKTIDLETNYKRLKSTNGYYVIRNCSNSYKGLVRLRTKSDIINFVNSKNVILIDNDLVYFPMKLQSVNNNIYILIQEIVHEVIMIKKLEHKDDINFEYSKHNKLIDMFPYKPSASTIKEENNLKMTTDGFYVDGELFTEPLSTKYSIFINNISVQNNFIAKYFNQIFKYVVTKNKENFIKTWVINVMLKTGIQIDYDCQLVKSILEKYYKL